MGLICWRSLRGVVMESVVTTVTDVAAAHVGDEFRGHGSACRHSVTTSACNGKVASTHVQD